MQGKNNGEEENRGQHLQSSFALLEYLPKSIFYILYTISKLRKSRIQRFKPCMIWSWNEEDMAFGRQLHQAMGTPFRKVNFTFARRFSSWCETWPFRTMKNHLAKFRKVAFHLAKFGPFIFPLAKMPLKSPILRHCWWYSTAGSPRYFAWFLAL